MKKSKFFMAFLLIFIFISSSTFAAGYSSTYISVRYNDSNRSVRQVEVLMDGQAVRFDSPAFIADSTTFVPIRFVTERYGADVDWDQSTKTATLKTDSNEIKLTINSTDVYINGEKETLQDMWIPKLVTYNYGANNADSRTMVPLRFISETLGYEVGYDVDKGLPYINTDDENKDEDNISITELLVEEGGKATPKVTIKGDDKLSYSEFKLTSPTRLVLDIENAELDVKDGIGFENGVASIEVNQGLMKSINISQFSSDPKVVRVVLNLDELDEYTIVSEEDGKTLTIQIDDKEEDKPVEAKYKVDSIKKEKIDGKDALAIYTSDKVEIKTLRLSNPERLILDLMDSSLTGGPYLEYDYDIGFIGGVRASQFDSKGTYASTDNVVRVVLDIKEGVNNPEVKVSQEDGKISIVPISDTSNVINYNRKGIKGNISIITEAKTKYDVDYNERTKTMTVEIPVDKIDIEEGPLGIEDVLIKNIKVEKDEDNYRFIISFNKEIEYDILSANRDDKIEISFESTEEIVNSDRVIVIDPGHGGSDPGACQNGFQEKDINLPVSLKLERLLKDLGYNVIMTRDTDVYITLQDRARIANENNADIFVSIHSNSFTANPAIEGVQVLYCPAFESSLKTGDNYPLAESIMDEFLSGTGAVDKGIIKRPELYVLKSTSMPAVIVEMGFLTNLEEAKKLNDDSYQDIMAESLANGIERYFEMY